MSAPVSRRAPSLHPERCRRCRHDRVMHFPPRSSTRECLCITASPGTWGKNKELCTCKGYRRDYVWMFTVWRRGRY